MVVAGCDFCVAALAAAGLSRFNALGLGTGDALVAMHRLV